MSSHLEEHHSESDDSIEYEQLHHYPTNYKADSRSKADSNQKPS
jgi:hypothetical protein